MQTAQTLNLGSGTGRIDPPPHNESDSTKTQELLDETRSYMNRTWTRLDRQQEEHDSHQRRTRILSIALSLLFVLLGVAAWFTLPAVRDHRNTVADILGLQHFSNELGQRLGSAETNINKISTGVPALSDRMGQLESSMKTNLQAARNQAQAAATRIREDVNQSIKAIQSRLSGLESNQRESSERVNQLQDQVAGLQKDLAAMREESSTATARIKELTDAQQSSSRDLSGLNDRIAAHQSALSTLTTRVDRRRVEFDANRGATQIAPDIYLILQRADTGKQEVDALLKVGADGGSLPIRAQGIRKPVLFYGSDDTRPVELVFTQVAKNRVSGYVIMPAQPPESAASPQ